MMKLLTLMGAALIALMMPGVAPAAAGPVLKSVARVSGDIVTVGDLIEGAGPFAREAIYRSPDLGTTGSVPATQVVERASALGLTGIRTGGIVDVVVSRQAHDVTPEDFTTLISGDIARKLGTSPDTLEITYEQSPEIVRADQTALNPLRLVDLSYVTSTGRFDATLSIDRGLSTQQVRLRGTATEMVDVVTLARAVERGDTIAKEDVIVQRLAKRQALRIGGMGAADIVGKSARRALRPGVPVTSADFGAPIAVRKGELVTLVVEMPRLMITLRGIAQDQGAIGDPIAVLNEQTKRTVRGVIAGPGRVNVTTLQTAVAAVGKVQQ